jgi:two-component system LytT family response regulator
VIRTAIVDDEPLVRERLRTLVENAEDLDLVAECTDGSAALALLGGTSVELLFLDVRMPGLDGFEVLEALQRRARGLPAAIVFVTAYDEFAVRAFEVDACDYLVKPITPDRFQAALRRARARLRATAPSADTDPERLGTGPVSPPRFLRRLFARIGNRVSFVALDDVNRIESAGNYLRVYTVTRRYVVRGTMKDIAARLDPSRFLRVRRSAIVNLDRVKAISMRRSGVYVIRFDDGTAVATSRSHGPAVRAAIRAMDVARGATIPSPDLSARHNRGA